MSMRFERTPWLRGAKIGLLAVSLAALAALAACGHGGRATADRSSAVGGIGYEFRVKRTFALGPTVNYSYISTDSFKADWVDGQLAFTWYFGVPQT